MLIQIKLEYVNCNLCGNDDTELLYEAIPFRHNYDKNYNNKFRVVKCRRCGLVYINPRPDAKSISSYYPESYEYHERRKISLLEKLYYKCYRFGLGDKKGRILDVGCGNGNYLLSLKNSGWDCYGTEMESYMVNYINEKLGLKVYKGELTDIELPKEYFDVITFWASLEHIPNPLKTIEKAKTLLKPDGKIIIWLQNINSLEARLFRDYWHHLEIPTHIYQFSPDTLSELMRKTGFKVEKIRFDISMGLIPSLEYFLNYHGIKIKINKLFIKILFLPVDFIFILFKTSGLMTIFSVKNKNR